MDALRNFSGSGTLDVAMEDKAATQPAYGRQPIGSEAKRAAVHEEIKRVTKLPPTSTYASHRLRVLNKILQLMAIQIVAQGMILYYMILISVKRKWMILILEIGTICFCGCSFYVPENYITRRGVGIAFCRAFSVNQIS